MTYKLFLDDMRLPHEVTWVPMLYDGRMYVVVRNYQQFCDTITERGLPDFVAFDHDLADNHYNGDFTGERTGDDAARWLVEYCREHASPLPAYVIHSMNPVGRQRIKDRLQSYKGP